MEVEAAFPGGESAWRRYLQNNLNTNAPIENGAPEGTYQVVVRFIVGRDGAISDVQARNQPRLWHGAGSGEDHQKGRNGPRPFKTDEM